MIITIKKKSLEEDLLTISKSFRAFDMQKDILSKAHCSQAAVDAIGHSVVRKFMDIASAGLRILWELRSRPDGTLPWIPLKDIYKKRDIYGVPVGAAVKADSICKLERDFAKNDISKAALIVFLENMEGFLRWLAEAIREELMKCESPSCDAIRRSESEIFTMDLAHMAFDLARMLENSPKEEACFDPRMNFILVNDEEERSDEELDRIYAPRVANSRKSLTPVFIIRILEEHSDFDNRLRQNQIIAILEDEYELEVERKAVGRYLANLVDEDLCIWTDENRTAYWYSEDKPDWY